MTGETQQAYEKNLNSALKKINGYNIDSISLDLNNIAIKNYDHIKVIDGKTITIFDEVGELINLYSVVDLAIVAGSIIFDKGHNFMEPIFANTLCITGSKLNNYKQLKKDLCDTNQIETFETKNQLRALVDKYKDSVIRNEKLFAQQKALEDLSGSYELIIDSLNDV